MLSLMIPEIGYVLELAQPWTFHLYDEGRNHTMRWKAEGWKKDSRYRANDGGGTVTLEKGVKLIVDRIYIRQGMKEFSSITFRIPNGTYGTRKGLRFWAKLSDVNRIKYAESSVEDNLPWYDGIAERLRNGERFQGHLPRRKTMSTFFPLPNPVTDGASWGDIKKSFAKGEAPEKWLKEGRNTGKVEIVRDLEIRRANGGGYALLGKVGKSRWHTFFSPDELIGWVEG